MIHIYYIRISRNTSYISVVHFIAHCIAKFMFVIVGGWMEATEARHNVRVPTLPVTMSVWFFCVPITIIYVENLSIILFELWSRLKGCLYKKYALEKSIQFFTDPPHSCILTMNKTSLAVTQLHRLLVYIEMQTDLWLDQFMLSVHTSTI